MINYYDDILWSFNKSNDNVNFSTDNDTLDAYKKPIVSLWRAVILQAIMDIVTDYKRTDDKVEKFYAKNWALNFSEDFITVCEFAELDPKSVHKNIKEICKMDNIKNITTVIKSRLNKNSQHIFNITR